MDKEEKRLVSEYFDLIRKNEDKKDPDWFGKKFNYFYGLSIKAKRNVILALKQKE